VTVLHDISPVVSPRLGVWPGDTPAERSVLLDLARGDTVTLSTLRATVHLGAHADAPSHYGLGAADIAGRSLHHYLGPCQLVRAVVPRGGRVTRAMIADPITEPRVVIATGTFPDPNHWNPDFAALDPELVDQLAAQGVVLIGIDTPSVDLQESKDLPAHRRFLAHDIAILEGLVLDHVPPGRYELIALPLRLEGFDASPIRAVLRAG
jgi:arylformamidase